MNNTDKAFFTWLRSGLRKLSQRWPPIYQALAAAKRPYVGDNKRKKFVWECAKCGGLFNSNEVDVDHIKEAGTLLKLDDLPTFVANLFCSTDGLQVLCKPCHSIRTYTQRYACTEQEAIIAKKGIAFSKLTATEQNKALQELVGDANINIARTKTAAKRKEYYLELLKGEC